MALKNVRRYDANGRELTEKDLETFRLDSPVVREILANLNREVTEGIRQKEKKVTIEDVIKKSILPLAFMVFWFWMTKTIMKVSGQPYWSWYGFNSRVEWCACFVSWCANECGYIDAGVIPKYAGCVNGVQWFKDRGQWLDGSAEPAPGMIIFFDWADESGQDGLSDHTGIVQKVENGKVYTVEGNSGDSCRVNEYSIGYYEILGYGAPAY